MSEEPMDEWELGKRLEDLSAFARIVAKAMHCTSGLHFVEVIEAHKGGPLQEYELKACVEVWKEAERCNDMLIEALTADSHAKD